MFKACCVALTLLLATAASAAEFVLQFPATSGNHRTLRVAGYGIDAQHVTGPCDTSITTSSGGRGAHYVTHFYYAQCTWDVRGNLLGSVSLPAPLPSQAALTASGTQSIFAYGPKGSYTGSAAGHGFVVSFNTLYSFAPAPVVQGVNGVPVTFTETLLSTGDFPLSIADVSARVVTLPGPGVTSSVVINATSCRGAVLNPGQSCSITATFLLSEGTNENDGTVVLGQAVKFIVISDATVTSRFVQTLAITWPAN